MIGKTFLVTLLLAFAHNSIGSFSSPRLNAGRSPDVTKLQCPKIEMDYPDPFDEKAPLRFEVHINGVDPNERLKYSWFVSKGIVKSGQGTSSIVVEAKGSQRQGLTATVVICGLPYECENEVSRTTAIANLKRPQRLQRANRTGDAKLRAKG